MTLRIAAVQPGTAYHEKGETGTEDERELPPERAPVERAIAGGEQREAEHEQDVRDDRPVIEPRTTSGRPLLIAKMAMISSGALPKLALRKPPTPAPVCSPACSVASPISHASGTSAAAARMKSSVSSASKTKRARTAIGPSASDAQRRFRPTPVA